METQQQRIYERQPSSGAAKIAFDILPAGSRVRDWKQGSRRVGHLPA